MRQQDTGSASLSPVSVISEGYSPAPCSAFLTATRRSCSSRLASVCRALGQDSEGRSSWLVQASCLEAMMQDYDLLARKHISMQHTQLAIAYGGSWLCRVACGQHGIASLTR